MRVHVGYEVTEGSEPIPVSVPMHHMCITGMTRLSGKTTTIEALLWRLPEEFTSLVFRAKRGEVEFGAVNRVKPYYRQEVNDVGEVNWQYVESLLEAMMKQRLRFERSWLIRACEGAESLRQVYENIKRSLDAERIRGIDESVYTNLRAYLEKLLPQLEEHPFADELELQAGPNVMELEQFSDEVQALVISSCLEEIYRFHDHTVVVIPEAWEYVPQSRGNPVKWSAQRVIRQGGASENYLWLDSQDVTMVSKDVLKSVGIWLLGRQQEINEVKRVIEQLPIREKPRPQEIMTLPVGHFYLAVENTCRKVYVQPAWMDDPEAIMVASGRKSLENVIKGIPPRITDNPPGPDSDPADEQLKGLLAQAELAKAQLEAECITLQQKVLDYERCLARAEEELEELRPLSRLQAALQDAVNVVPPARPTELTESVIDDVAVAVARKLGTAATFTMVAPLEALKKQYQQETVKRLAQEMDGFNPRVREALKWLIAVGKPCSLIEICRNLGFPPRGESFTRFSQGMKALVPDEWVSQDSHGFKSKLNEKVAKALAVYNASPEEIDATFSHLVAKLAKEQLAGLPNAENTYVQTGIKCG